MRLQPGLAPAPSGEVADHALLEPGPLLPLQDAREPHGVAVQRGAHLAAHAICVAPNDGEVALGVLLPPQADVVGHLRKVGI